MAVEPGVHYTVEVKSRFQLFLQDEEGVDFDGSHGDKLNDTPSSKASHPDHAQKRANQRNAAPQKAGRVQEHIKEEVRGQRHRGHVVPHHGRDFDRKSGSDKTGVKAVPKKGGYGAGNWGTMQDEMEATMGEKQLDLDLSGEGGKEGEQEQEPPSPPTLTLEEFKAMKKVVAAQSTGRPANDGKDVFKDMKLIKSDKPKAEVDAPKFASVYHQPNESGIALTVAPSRGGSGGMRGRGGDRERRGGRGGQVDRPLRERRDDKPRGAGPQSARGGPAPRGARGGRGGMAPAEARKPGISFDDKNFPPLAQ